ncbi:MAG: hypothetical protein ACAI43_22555, partial [Phycisphaerae bacterium]|nr:hypothetical protein [Tepidisphaeraceae bacterium]
ELRDGEDAGAVARNRAAGRVTGPGAAGPSRAADDTGPVVRLYDATSATVDLRTGLICPAMPTADDLRRMVLAGAALPPEVAAGDS